MTWDEFGNLSIATFIALQPPTACESFASLLLDNVLTVQNIRDKNPQNDGFVQEVLYKWYSMDTPVPCTWNDLIQRMKSVDFPQRWVDVIERNTVQRAQ